MAVVRAIDDGDPIALDERDRIFQPYTTLSSRRPVTGSIGLGLTVSRQLAVLMNGDLRYEPGEGHSAFTLTIPIGDDAHRRSRHQDHAPGESVGYKVPRSDLESNRPRERARR